MTYTIAITEPTRNQNALLLATVPDGQDIHAAAGQELLHNYSPDTTYQTISGLALTDDPPDDTALIVWQGHACGSLIDENGGVFDYAVRTGTTHHYGPYYTFGGSI